MTRTQVSETDFGPAGALAAVRDVLARYTFIAPNEADLQRQVAGVLAGAGMSLEREARVERGVVDIRVVAGPVNLALELKVRGAAAAVERQAQRYARCEDVDAVAVVTTSQRLATALLRQGDAGQPPADTLGGKPFGVIALRGF